MSQVPALGAFRMNAGCLEASVLLPTASRLHPHRRTSVFAHISLIYGRFRELTRGISLIYMALVLVGKAISGVKIYPLSHLVTKGICHI